MPKRKASRGRGRGRGGKQKLDSKLSDKDGSFDKDDGSKDEKEIDNVQLDSMEDEDTTDKTTIVDSVVLEEGQDKEKCVKDSINFKEGEDVNASATETDVVSKSCVEHGAELQVLDKKIEGKEMKNLENLGTHRKNEKADVIEDKSKLMQGKASSSEEKAIEEKSNITKDKTSEREEKSNITEEKTSEREEKANVIEDTANEVQEEENVAEDKVNVIVEKAIVIEEKVNVIEEKANVIEERENIIEEKVNVIEERENIIQEKVNVIEERENIIQEKVNVIEERENIIEEKVNVIEERKNIIEEKVNVIEEKANVIEENANNDEKYQVVSETEHEEIENVEPVHEDITDNEMYEEVEEDLYVDKEEDDDVQYIDEEIDDGEQDLLDVIELCDDDRNFKGKSSEETKSVIQRPGSLNKDEGKSNEDERDAVGNTTFEEISEGSMDPMEQEEVIEAISDNEMIIEVSSQGQEEKTANSCKKQKPSSMNEDETLADIFQVTENDGNKTVAHVKDNDDISDVSLCDDDGNLSLEEISEDEFEASKRRKSDVGTQPSIPDDQIKEKVNDDGVENVSDVKCDSDVADLKKRASEEQDEVSAKRQKLSINEEGGNEQSKDEFGNVSCMTTLKSEEKTMQATLASPQSVEEACVNPQQQSSTFSRYTDVSSQTQPFSKRGKIVQCAINRVGESAIPIGIKVDPELSKKNKASVIYDKYKDHLPSSVENIFREVASSYSSEQGIYSLTLGPITTADFANAQFRDICLSTAEKFNLSFNNKLHGLLQAQFSKHTEVARLIQNLKSLDLGIRYMIMSLVYKPCEEIKSQEWQAILIFTYSQDNSAPMMTRDAKDGKVRSKLNVSKVPEGISKDFVQLVFPEALFISTRVAEENVRSLSIGFSSTKITKEISSCYELLLINGEKVVIESADPSVCEPRIEMDSGVVEEDGTVIVPDIEETPSNSDKQTAESKEKDQAVEDGNKDKTEEVCNTDKEIGQQGAELVEDVSHEALNVPNEENEAKDAHNDKEKEKETPMDVDTSKPEKIMDEMKAKELEKANVHEVSEPKSVQDEGKVEMEESVQTSQNKEQEDCQMGSEVKADESETSKREEGDVSKNNEIKTAVNAECEKVVNDKDDGLLQQGNSEVEIMTPSQSEKLDEISVDKETVVIDSDDSETVLDEGLDKENKLESAVADSADDKSGKDEALKENESADKSGQGEKSDSQEVGGVEDMAEKDSARVEKTGVESKSESDQDPKSDLPNVDVDKNMAGNVSAEEETGNLTDGGVTGDTDVGKESNRTDEANKPKDEERVDGKDTSLEDVSDDEMINAEVKAAESDDDVIIVKEESVRQVVANIDLTLDSQQEMEADKDEQESKEGDKLDSAKDEVKEEVLEDENKLTMTDGDLEVVLESIDVEEEEMECKSVLYLRTGDYRGKYYNSSFREGITSAIMKYSMNFKHTWTRNQSNMRQAPPNVREPPPRRERDSDFSFKHAYGRSDTEARQESQRHYERFSSIHSGSSLEDKYNDAAALRQPAPPSRDQMLDRRESIKRDFRRSKSPSPRREPSNDHRTNPTHHSMQGFPPPAANKHPPLYYNSKMQRPRPLPQAYREQGPPDTSMRPSHPSSYYDYKNARTDKSYLSHPQPTSKYESSASQRGDYHQSQKPPTQTHPHRHRSRSYSPLSPMSVSSNEILIRSSPPAKKSRPSGAARRISHSPISPASRSLSPVSRSPSPPSRHTAKSSNARYNKSQPQKSYNQDRYSPLSREDSLERINSSRRKSRSPSPYKRWERQRSRSPRYSRRYASPSPDRDRERAKDKKNSSSSCFRTSTSKSWVSSKDVQWRSGAKDVSAFKSSYDKIKSLYDNKNSMYKTSTVAEGSSGQQTKPSDNKGKSQPTSSYKLPSSITTVNYTIPPSASSTSQTQPNYVAAAGTASNYLQPSQQAMFYTNTSFPTASYQYNVGAMNAFPAYPNQMAASMYSYLQHSQSVQHTHHQHHANNPYTMYSNTNPQAAMNSSIPPSSSSVHSTNAGNVAGTKRGGDHHAQPSLSSKQQVDKKHWSMGDGGNALMFQRLLTKK